MSSKNIRYIPIERLYKINDRITAPEIRLIDEFSKQIGVISLSAAKNISYNQDKDLIEIISKAKPPIVKLIELSKFKYQEAKKLKSQSKGNKKGGELKEVQLSPFISDNDYLTQTKKARKFFASGNKVKLNVKFQGRQITRKEFGYDILNRFKNDLADISQPEGESKLIGKKLQIIFKPTKKNPHHEKT